MIRFGISLGDHFVDVGKKLTSFFVHIQVFFATWKSCMVLTSLPLFSAFEFAPSLCCRPLQCYEIQGLLLKQACVQESTKCLSERQYSALFVVRSVGNSIQLIFMTEALNHINTEGRRRKRLMVLQHFVYSQLSLTGFQMSPLCYVTT